jgi:hypothetical protein
MAHPNDSPMAHVCRAATGYCGPSASGKARSCFVGHLGNPYCSTKGEAEPIFLNIWDQHIGLTIGRLVSGVKLIRSRNDRRNRNMT